MKSYVQDKRSSVLWEHWYYRFYIMLISNIIPSLMGYLILFFSGVTLRLLIYLGIAGVSLLLLQTVNPNVTRNSPILYKFYAQMSVRKEWKYFYFRFLVVMIADLPVWLILLVLFTQITTFTVSLGVLLVIIVAKTLVIFFKEWW